MKIDVSIGELIDKASILDIKIEKIKDKDKLKNIRYEYDLLLEALRKINLDAQSPEFLELKKINLRLWNIEDKIRLKEFRNEFDEEFIQLARSVYRENDKRAEIKRAINLKFNSAIIEEKEYQKYI